jgi:ssDNA-binding replication factor A large subunit
MTDAEFITTDQAKERTNKINILGKITTKGETREAKGYKICTCKLTDPKGDVDLTLWNEMIPQVNTGDIVKITNGYMKEFQEKKSLNVGKFGKLEVVEQAPSA